MICVWIVSVYFGIFLWVVVFFVSLVFLLSAVREGEKNMLDESKKESHGRIQSTDVFPNHLMLQGVNFSVDLGSFDLSMKELMDIGLFCLSEMKKIEQE